MTAPELKRYDFRLMQIGEIGTGCGRFIAKDGKYVRFTDVEAYTQAAIAAAMMRAVKPLVWIRDDRDDGVEEWIADSILGKHEVRFQMIRCAYNVIVNGKEVIWNCRDDVLAKTMANEGYSNSILSTLSIPADAMAALEAVKAQVRDEALEEATLDDVLNLLARHVSGMDQETFFQFACAIDKAFEPHDQNICAAAIRAMKGGA